MIREKALRRSDNHRSPVTDRGRVTRGKNQSVFFGHPGAAGARTPLALIDIAELMINLECASSDLGPGVLLPHQRSARSAHRG